MKKENKYLKNEINLLKNEINLLKNENEKSRQEHEDLKNYISNIEPKLKLIDVRESFRALENYIVLDVLGSKSKMRKLRIYTIPKLIKTQEFIQCKKWKGYRYDQMFDLIYQFKEMSNDFIHGTASSGKDNLLNYLISKSKISKMKMKTKMNINLFLLKWLICYIIFA